MPLYEGTNTVFVHLICHRANNGQRVFLATTRTDFDHVVALYKQRWAALNKAASVRHAQLVHPAMDRLPRLEEGPLQIGEVIRLAVVVRNVVAQMQTAVVADVVQ